MILIRILVIMVSVLVCACAVSEDKTVSRAVVSDVWQEVVVSVTDIERTAAFFTEIGGYETKWRGALSASEIAAWGLPEDASGEALLLGQDNRDEGFVRLVRFDNAGMRVPTRPGARPWDTGCYFSIMVRMKDMQSIYDDAIEMGWWTETPIVNLSFGDSYLNVVVFRGPDGVQVQGYERLSLPLPAAFPEFERFSGPFNMMQMVRDKDASYAFYTDVLGFETFHNGAPYVDAKPTFMPLGIPVNLTTTVPYKAGITYPFVGETGRMETIEIDGLDGRDHASRCHAPNLGILAVRFPVADIRAAAATIEQRGWKITQAVRELSVAPYGQIREFTVKTPDGANIHFMQ